MIKCKKYVFMAKTSSDTAILLGMTKNGKQYNSIHESDTTAMCNNTDSIHESDTTPMYNSSDLNRHSNTVNTPFGVPISRISLTITISVATAVAAASNAIIVPIYVTNVVEAGSDPFVVAMLPRVAALSVYLLVIVIRWCYTREVPRLSPNTRYMTAALIGFLIALKGLLSVFGSLPDRTRSELLGILSAAILPNTVICRYIMLRKVVGVRRLMCVVIVILGLFVSMIPDIFNMESINETTIDRMKTDYPIANDPPLTTNRTDDTSLYPGSTVVYSWVWPLVLVVRTLPMAITHIIIEREIKSPEVSFMTFLFWTQVFNCFSIVLLFWTDLIPGFGMSRGIDEFLTSLKHGLYCSFSTEPFCNGCLAPALLFIASLPCTDVFPMLLTKHAEGATYTVIIMSCSRPISALFWTLFHIEGLDGLLWRPRFNLSTILTFVGLLIIIPATCLYAYLSNSKGNVSVDKLKEAKET